jgi:hypothetical protein
LSFFALGDHELFQWSRVGPETRYYHMTTVDGLRAFVIRCNVEDLATFEHSLRAWGRGSNYVNLTDEQYAKLKPG